MDWITGHEIFGGHEGEKKVEGLSEAIFQVLVDNGYLELEGGQANAEDKSSKARRKR